MAVKEMNAESLVWLSFVKWTFGVTLDANVAFSLWWSCIFHASFRAVILCSYVAV